MGDHDETGKGHLESQQRTKALPIKEEMLGGVCFPDLGTVKN